MKPHKWAKEIHAIADGIEVQWAWESRKLWSDWDREYDASPITSRDGIIWRIKPPEVAQWRKDMAKALEDGKVVDVLTINGWCTSITAKAWFLDPEFIFLEKDYRIRPEPKPDVVKYGIVDKDYFVGYLGRLSYKETNLKVVFDGETGKPISAEVL